MILWSLDVRSPPLDVVAVHRVGEPLVTPLVWRTLSCYLVLVILLSVARGVCVYSNASNHRCKLLDFWIALAANLLFPISYTSRNQRVTSWFRSRRKERSGSQESVEVCWRSVYWEL